VTDDAFERLAMMATASNGLFGARREAEQHFAKLAEDTGELFHSGQIMRRAWDSLRPEDQEDALDSCLNAYYIQAHELQDAVEKNRLAREAGYTFLEHDDLDVIAYTCFGVENGDGGVDSSALVDEVMPVQVALVGRLIDEIELLRAKLRLKGEG
jgi:hypothetical protein